MFLVSVRAHAAPASAQVDGSFGVGAGTVRYPGGASFGSAILSPAVRYTSEALVADLSSSIASLPGGEWAGLGLADLSAVTAPSAAFTHVVWPLLNVLSVENAFVVVAP